MNELPNTVGQEAAFWERQRTLPHGAERPEEPVKRMPAWLIVCIYVAAAVAFVTAISIARAAERERPHDLWLLVKPTAVEWAAANEQRGQFKIGTGYQNRSQCEAVKREMRKVAGTLQCHPFN